VSTGSGACQPAQLTLSSDAGQPIFTGAETGQIQLKDASISKYQSVFGAACNLEAPMSVVLMSISTDAPWEIVVTHDGCADIRLMLDDDEAELTLDP
jgi:hypothetical protein